jgi:hypothetical protein
VSIVVVALVAAGLVVGFLVARWWALLAAAALGVVIALTEEVEVAGWWLGLAYSGLAALGIVAGIVLRRLARRGTEPS